MKLENMYKKVLTCCLLVIASIFTVSCKGAHSKKILYVDHEPGNYHLTVPQKHAFMEMAAEQGWEVTNLTGTDEQVVESLAASDFAEGYDLVVYNICVAKSDNLIAAHNVIRQTEELGVPALVIHGTLHSFWPTFKMGDTQVPGQPAKAKTSQKLLDKWETMKPGETFPAWSRFTGIASFKHGPRKPIEIRSTEVSHFITEGFKPFRSGKNSELYNNAITPQDSPNSVVLLEGYQNVNKNRVDSAAVLWEHPLGESKVVVFSLGHDMIEWQQPEVLNIISNSVNYLLGANK